MQDREKLMETMDALVNIASIQNNTITMDEIKEAFQDAHLEDFQFEPIYAYLAENKITIKDYISKEIRTYDESPESKEDSTYVQIYLDDLTAIEECKEEELIKLFLQLKAGEDSAKTRIIEGYLHQVVAIANEYRGKGIIIGDLIQEGNLGLIDAVSSLSENIETSGMKQHLYKGIRTYIENAIEEQYIESRKEKDAVLKIGRLSDAAKKLEEELGRHPLVAEVATYMKLTEEEVINIMRLSKETHEEHHH